MGHLDEIAVFVPDTAPGDVVRVELQQRKRRWARGALVDLLEPGPDRQQAACPMNGRCGGCQWHHVRYEAQLKAKQGLLERAFRQARIPITAEPFVAAPTPLAYRGRARLHWRAGADPVALGFRGRRSHQLVDLQRCPVLLHSLDTLLAPLHAALRSARGEGELHLLGNEQGRAALALHGGPHRPTARALGALPAVDGAVVRAAADDRGADVHGRPELDQEPEGATPFWTTPETFFQASPAANRRLRQRLQDWVGEVEGPVLELFAGAGNLTRVLAHHAEVIAVESQADAVALARRNLEGLPVKLRTADAAQAVERADHDGLRPGLVVLDPPRVGARDVARALAALRPPRILYVSCDPMTLARDVAELASAGYLLRRVGGLDTMPQTFHFETVAELALP